MRKSSEIQKELNESKELAKAEGLMADEKDFIEEEIADLEKELASALEAEKTAPKKEPVKKAAPKKKESTKKPKAKKTVTTEKTVVKTSKAPKAPKEKAFIIFEGKKIFEDDAEYCSKLVQAWRQRKEAQKKAAGKRKTKPVTQRVAANIASAVSKGIETISAKEIKNDPKKAIAKMERLEKAGKEFLDAFKDILGEKITQKEIKEEFEGLDRTINEISKKYLKKKFSDGGDVLSLEEKHELRVLRALSGFNNGLNRNSLFESLGLSNYRFSKYATKEEYAELMKTLKRLEDKGFISVDGDYDSSLTTFKHTSSGRKYLDSFSIGVYAKGGDTKKTYYYAVATTGKSWDENKQEEFYGTWKDVVKKAYDVAVKNKSQVRVSESEGFNNQGHYFHYSNAPK